MTSTVYWRGLRWVHMADVIFFFDGYSNGEDSHCFDVTGIVTSTVSGSDGRSGCSYWATPETHLIPSETDWPLTDAWLLLGLWTDPPSYLDGGSVMIDLEISERCPQPRGTFTSTIAPPWASLFIGECITVQETIDVLAGSFTALGATLTSWSRWEWHLERLEPAD